LPLKTRRNSETVREIVVQLKQEFKVSEGISKTIKDEFYLECSGCGEKLAHIVVTELIETETPVQALCPFCGDKSYVKQVKGLFNIGCTEKTKLANFSEKVINKEIVNIIELEKA